MLSVKIAATREENEAALRLRYEVFFVEGGDARYADHERRIWSDRDDGPQSHLIIAVNDANHVIGTVRVTILREWDFIGREAYHVDVLAAYLGIPLEELLPQIARMDRGAIAKESRGSGVFPLLEQLAVQTSLNNNCPIMVSAPGIDNVPSRRASAKLGWREYPAVGTHAGFTAQLIYKVLDGRSIP